MSFIPAPAYCRGILFIYFRNNVWRIIIIQSIAMLVSAVRHIEYKHNSR